MNISKKLIYLCATVLTAFLSVGCSQSDNGDTPDNPDVEPGVEVPVRITISALPNNAQTRADGTPKDPTSSIELIHDWWIVFIDNNGGVKVITRNEVEEVERTTSTSVNIEGNGFEAETFRTTLPTGTYRIYAFANVDPWDIDKIKEKMNTKTHKLDNIHISDFVETPLPFINSGSQWPDDKKIPMTGVIPEQKIRNTVEEIFNIEVIRAIAKVEFAFSNPSYDKITLEELKFGPIANDPTDISAVPNNDAIGFCANDKLQKDRVKAGTMTFDKDSSPSLISLTIDPTGKYDMGILGFYCNESLPRTNDKQQLILGDDDDGFNIKLKVTKNGETETIDYEYETKTIKYINRNDWILIPIKFNDWIVYWKLHYYPPIGGYPPVFRQNEDGSSLSATLTTGGEFELYPYQIKRNSEEADYFNDVDWDSVEITEITELTETEKSLFIKLPTVMVNPSSNIAGHPLANLPNMIAGELDPKATGTAVVKFSFNLNNKDKDNQNIPYADTKFDCTFTIIRQNQSITQ